MKKIIPIILVIVFSVTTGFAQKGKDGAQIISSSNVIVNEYTALTNDATAGDNSITVSDNTLNANNRFPNPLGVGDLVMIIQIQGATINKTVNDSTWGTVTNYNNCGLYEVEQVTGVTGSTVINLGCPLKNNYSDTGRVEVVRIPRYTSLTINDYDTLTCDAWNGTVGGVLAVEVSGKTFIYSNGAVNASAKGFRGGALENNGLGGGKAIFLNYATTNVANGAEKGEGIAGYQSDYTIYNGEYGRGAAANAGGGGNAWNSAGGGGANAGDTTKWTGNGNPDTTTDTSWRQAWRLEYWGFANSTSSGGGRGGYATGSYAVGPLTIGPNNAAWDPQFQRENDGGKGGRPLDYSAGRLFLGGGGGAGHQDNGNGGAGGEGGGLIYFLSYDTVSGSGSIISNGQNGGDNAASTSSSGDGDGSGGGGAGGTIIINSSGPITNVSAYTNGGNGGSQYVYFYVTENEGPGGGGGGGYIVTSNTITNTVSGGTNGTTDSYSMATFLPDGATTGGGGIATTFSSSCNLSLGAITGPLMACSGATITYSVPSGCSNATYNWTLPTGWTGTSTTNTITVTVGLNSGTISVESCPFDTSLTVTIVPATLSVQPQSPTICVGESINLLATGNGNFTWSPSTGLNTTTGDSVVATPTLTTTYMISGLDSAGCTATASDTITVVPAPNKPTISQHGDTLVSSAATGNEWFRNDTLIPGATGQYLIIGNSTNTYTVSVVNPADGCSSKSDPVSTSGISQLAGINNQISIYPNPTNGNITLTINPSLANAKEMSLQVIDVIGQVLYERATLNYSNVIDLTYLPGGVYFVTVLNKIGRVVFPIMKE